ncbi:hypothetical protein [Pyrolobus fumarii]|uniref:hypothetical protein n=1 Tax=Pyrolobus fumarii TaxID=54252 RepID=UPI00064F256A|nr:hypothetical protein [Pyrolobus fumarii]
MRAKLYGFGVASKVHGREYYEKIWEEFRSLYQSLNIEPFQVITDENDVKMQAGGLQEADAVFIAVLTGGSSKLIKMMAEAMGGKKPIVLLAHGFHNSMASALSAKSRLESEGYPVYLIEALRPSDAVEEAAAVVRAVRAVVELRNLKVLQIDAERVYDEGVEASRRFGFRVENVTSEELDKTMENVDVREVYEYLRSHFDLGGVDARLLEKPVRLAAAAKKLASERGASAVTIDCFPFIMRKGATPCLMMSYLLDEGVISICEADYRALVLMTIAKMLTGKPGWIANPSHYDPRTRTLVLAHCTAASSLGSYSTLIPHFETGNPYAVVTKIEPGTYTLTAISPDFRKLAFALAEVVESGMLSAGRCRTQVVAKLEERSPEPFTAKAISNHHVLIVGDVRRELRIVAKLLGMEVIEY